MRASTRTKLAGVLDTQQQVIGSRQIIAATCDHELAGREVAGARWQDAARGVYFAFESEPTLLQRGWCGQLIGGDASVISGPLACHLLGIADAPDRSAVVLVPSGCHRKGADGYVVRRVSRLPTWTDMEGVRVASATRAVVDACRTTKDLREVRALACAAINGGHTSYDELVTESAAQPRSSLALLARALRDWADGARSAPEAEVADALREQVWAGRMPPFLLNPKVYAGAVLLGSPDVYVPGCALGGETDSVRHHGSAADLEATLRRDAMFRHHGVCLEHVTPTQFRRDPAAWAARFATLAAERSALGDPAQLRVEPIGPRQLGRRP